MTISLESLISLEGVLHFNQFSSKKYLLDFLGKNLREFILELLHQQYGMNLDSPPKLLGKVHPTAVVEGPVYVDEEASVGPHTYIQGPCFIGPKSDVRHGAFIRGDVYVGKSCVVGHTTEVKSSIFFDEAKAGHFAYVGDSILGRRVNLGAGTKLANMKFNHGDVSWLDPLSKQKIKTGLKKLGSVIGDDAQTGCNSVLSPGTLLLPKTAVLPCVHFFGTLENGFAK